jgi:hypothetical protein
LSASRSHTRQEPRLQEQRRARFERMAPYVESTGADGVYGVIEKVEPHGSR